MSANEYCPGHGTEPTGTSSDLRVVECRTCTPLREHVIIAAFGVTAETRKDAEEYLHTRLPRPGRRGDEYRVVEDWWIAEDTRYDRSDNDSAVFCIPGKQEQARDALRSLGLAY